MSRIITAILIVSVAFSLWGYIWYAAIFDDIWQELIGRSETDLLNLAVSRGSLQTIFTFLVSIAQVTAILLILMWTRACSRLQYVGVSAVLSTLLVLPSIGNATLFAGTPLLLLALDYGYFLTGYVGISLLLFTLAPPGKGMSNQRDLTRQY